MGRVTSMWLHDCVSKDPSETELLILGSSAAYEAAKVNRDRMTQALFSVDKSFLSGGDICDVLSNSQCQGLIAALGVGVLIPSSPGKDNESFDMTNLRYGRILIVTENCEVGLGIYNEIIRFFLTYMGLIISSGHVFVPKTPLEPGFTQEEFRSRILNNATRHIQLIEEQV